MQPSVARYRARVHPCGVATVGLIPPYKKLAEERERESLAKKLLSPLNLEGDSIQSCLAREISAGHLSVAEAIDYLDALSLSSLQNSRNEAENTCCEPVSPEGSKPIKSYGQSGITGFGKLRVKDGAALMEQEYGRRSLAFATVTLPTMSKRKMRLLCESWGEFVHRIVEEIKRELVRKQSPVDIIHVTEIQEHRYRKYGDVAPHLHLLWYAYDRAAMAETGRREYAIDADWLRDLVKRLIYNITGDEKVSTKASCNIQKVKKSAVGYLGKYMSKGGKIVNDIKKDGKGALLPKQWWGITRELRDKVVRAIRVLENERASNLFYHAEKLQRCGLVKSIFHVYSAAKQSSELIKKHKYNADTETGEIKIDRDFRIADIGDILQDVKEKCYGAVLQLSPKGYSIFPVLARVLDICNHLSNADMDDIALWISAINNADMLNDVAVILDSMKEILEGKTLIRNSDDFQDSYIQKDVELLLTC